MMSRFRDQQRSRLYAAERTLPEGPTFESLAQTQRYVDAVTGSAWWKRHYGPSHIEVRDGRGRIKAGSLTGRAAITLPRRMRYKWSILHEMAHQATDWQYGPDLPAHGWQFARTYALLLKRFLGVDTFLQLLLAYTLHHVQCAAVKRGKHGQQ